MFIRQHMRKIDGKRQAYWALVESFRTQTGPRQRVVAWLGRLDEAGRLGIARAARAAAGDVEERDRQLRLFPEDVAEVEPRWVEVNAAGVRVENSRQFGGPWLALHIVRRLQLDKFLEETLPKGKESIPWSITSLVLIIARLLDPSSELYVSEQWYPKTALPELLGVPASAVDDNRLYRALDQLLPHKRALECHLKERLGTLFGLNYDLLLYDVTSTFFEGAAGFPMAQRGYSRDQRSDCKQVCIGLVVSRCGMPLGYEVFPGNTADVTTVQQIVTEMEERYGKSDRVWVMDRGMVSEKNLDFFRQGQRRYLVGTPKALLKQYERELLEEDWRVIRDGIEVKILDVPPVPGEVLSDSTAEASGQREVFLLCRSRDRVNKEAAILKRFEERIEKRLVAMTERCAKQKRTPAAVERDVGRLLGQNTRAARLFDVRVERREDGFARLHWKKVTAARDWADLSAGCYLLRTNVLNWSDEELWKTYMQLTEAEAAFRIHKTDLSLRPIWHQKEDRVLAHILVCFLSYVLWKTLGQMCRQAGLGDEPRRVLDELSEIRLLDVILPTREGVELKEECVAKPSDHQQILLDHLGLRLPSRLRSTSR